jgi:PAS domain S-box-containing protein
MYSILYVDDDPHLLDVARYFLEDSGEFTLATSLLATEALRRPDFSTFDAIISDYEMPRMDGIAFLKTVRESLGDVPFILFTGKGREEVVIEAINNGADFYLQKGGDPTAQFAELAHKIKKALERKRAGDALSESEQKYRDLFENITAGFALHEIICDESGTPVDYRFLMVNPAFETLTGLCRETILNRTVQDVLPGTESSWIEIYGRVALTGKSERFENFHQGLGRWFEVLVYCPKKGRFITVFSDITERKRLEADLEKNHAELEVSYNELKQAKAKLRRQFDLLSASERLLLVNEERLVMAQELGHTGSWEYDIATDRIWGSAEGLKMFGYPPVAGYIPIADLEACIMERERVHQALVDLLGKGTEYNIVYRIEPVDGSAPRVIHSVARLEKDAGGNPSRVIGVIHDITKEKKTEDTLRESEGRFRQIFNALPIGLWIADRKGKLLMGNRAGQKIWGADPKVGPEEYGVFKAWRMPLREPVEPGDWALGYAVNEGRVTEEELLEIEAFDTSHKYILNWAVPLKNEAGEITGAFVLNQDITEMVLWERELRESGEKYRTYIDSSPEGVFIVDGDGNIRDVNPAASSLLGYTKEEFLGLTVGDLLTDATREVELAGFARIAEDDVLAHELELKRRDGTTVPVILNAVRLPGDIYLGYCTDISKRKQDEEENWKARQILEGILNSIQVRVFWKDLTLRYLGCNTPFAHDAGFEKPEDIIGKDDFAMGWHEQADLYRSDDRAVIESGTPRYFIKEPQKTPEGKLITLLTSKVPLRDSDGSIIGVLGTYIDITGKKIG